MTEKRWYLVSYDIRAPERWRHVYRIMNGAGEHVQYSVFRCWLTPTQVEALRWELEREVEDEDDLLFVHLCPSCATRVRVRKLADGAWAQPRKRFQIL